MSPFQILQNVPREFRRDDEELPGLSVEISHEELSGPLRTLSGKVMFEDFTT